MLPRACLCVVAVTNMHRLSGMNFLHEATWVDQIGIAKLLLATGAFEGRMEEPTTKGHTALHLAAFRATPTFCSLLVHYGADANAKQKTAKWTPMSPAEVAEVTGKPASAKALRELTTTMDAVRFAGRLKKNKAPTVKEEVAVKA